MANIFNNDDVKQWLISNGFIGRSVNDGITAYLRDLFSSSAPLPDLLKQHLDLYGETLQTPTSKLLMETGEFLLLENTDNILLE